MIKALVLLILGGIAGFGFALWLVRMEEEADARTAALRRSIVPVPQAP